MAFLAVSLAVLAAGPARATILLGQPALGPASPTGDLVSQAAIADILDQFDAGAGAMPLDPGLPGEKEDPQGSLVAHGSGYGATACGTSAVQAPGAGGSANAALADGLRHIPPPTLITALPREAHPTMPTGPPFELLHVPR